MYFLNKQHAIANMAIYCKIVNGSHAAVHNLQLLRKEYFSSIEKRFRITLSKQEGIAISFDTSILADVLRDGDMFKGEGLTEEETFSDDEKTLINRNIFHALTIIKHIDSDLHDLISLVVSDIVCVRVQNSGGGTASNLPSIIWLSPHPLWTTIDYMECIIHETIHLTLFNGDLIYSIYNNPRGLQLIEDAHVISAIRKVKRPIDKSFHSACVAVGVAYLYHSLNMHDTVDSVIHHLTPCVEQLETKRKYLSSYGNTILDSLVVFVDTKSFNIVNKSFADNSLAVYNNFVQPHYA